jgi:hypothetical protein
MDTSTGAGCVAGIGEPLAYFPVQNCSPRLPAPVSGASWAGKPLQNGAFHRMGRPRDGGFERFVPRTILDLCVLPSVNRESSVRVPGPDDKMVLQTA